MSLETITLSQLRRQWGRAVTAAAHTVADQLSPLALSTLPGARLAGLNPEQHSELLAVRSLHERSSQTEIDLTDISGPQDSKAILTRLSGRHEGTVDYTLAGARLAVARAHAQTSGSELRFGCPVCASPHLLINTFEDSTQSVHTFGAYDDEQAERESLINRSDTTENFDLATMASCCVDGLLLGFAFGYLNADDSGAADSGTDNSGAGARGTEAAAPDEALQLVLDQIRSQL